MSKEPELPLPAWTARLSRRELARLLAQLLARICPRCLGLGTVRTSKGHLRYFRCRCGHRWKSCAATIESVDTNIGN